METRHNQTVQLGNSLINCMVSHVTISNASFFDPYLYLETGIVRYKMANYFVSRGCNDRFSTITWIAKENRDSWKRAEKKADFLTENEKSWLDKYTLAVLSEYLPKKHYDWNGNVTLSNLYITPSSLAADMFGNYGRGSAQSLINQDLPENSENLYNAWDSYCFGLSPKQKVVSFVSSSLLRLKKLYSVKQSINPVAYCATVNFIE
jgi:hypothetical protein